MSSQDLLHADASALEAAGRDFATAGDEALAAKNRMQTQVNSLQGSFQGSAAQAFFNKMDIIFRDLQLQIDEINEMSRDLQDTAQRVRQLQAEAENLLRD